MAKVLVVDDSGTMRKIVMSAVGKVIDQCEFTQAENGVAALEAMDKETFDLVLSDINMPEMDGIQLVQRIRGRTKTQTTGEGDLVLSKEVKDDTPIVMITTEGGLDMAQEALTAGASDYLKKPFTPEQLAEKIKPLLG